MPSWPIEIPSETEMVPNSSGKPSAPRTPTFACFASRSSDRLQGVISFQLLATPICGLCQSSSPIPTARSMPRAAARSTPSVTTELWGLRCGRRSPSAVGLLTRKPYGDAGEPCIGAAATRASRGRSTVYYRAGVGDVTTEPAKTAVFRLPRTAYLIVVFLVFGTVPLAFTDIAFERDSTGSVVAPPTAVGWQTALLLLPVIAIVFIARWATFVGADGVRVRAAFGSRRFAWDEIRGLQLGERDVYLVLADGAVRLPCVHVNSLAEVARASGGRLPQVADPRPKFAPAKGRRR